MGFCAAHGKNGLLGEVLVETSAGSQGPTRITKRLSDLLGRAAPHHYD